MLGFMGCGECGSVRGNYNASCSLCQKRKRRSEQQRNRRLGSPEIRVPVLPSSIRGIRDTQRTINRLRDYFTAYSRNPAIRIDERSLTDILAALNSSDRHLAVFLTAFDDSLEQERPKPVRRYRRRPATYAQNSNHGR